MTAELDAELESLDCEYGLSAENGDETELDVSVDPSSNTSGNEDQEANLDKSIEDENEIQAIDIFYGSACCSLGPKKAACWTQFHRKSVITARRESLELTRSELDLLIYKLEEVHQPYFLIQAHQRLPGQQYITHLVASKFVAHRFVSSMLLVTPAWRILSSITKPKG